jgi:chaperonin GroES
MIPTLNRILVTPPAAESADEKSEGGLFIPQVAREQSKFVQGTVRAVGPDVKQVKVDDVVLYNREQGHEISEAGNVVAVLVEDKHIAVVL